MLLIDYWKSIKDYDDLYSGSCWGNIRSWDRTINYINGRKSICKGRILKPGLDKGGYLLVNLCKNGSHATKKVHRLIAETFIPNPNNCPQVNHSIASTKTINCVPNLEWCSASHNIRHAFKNGLSSKVGEKNSRAKLTKKQVVEIKAQLLHGCRCVDIAKQYGVNPATISMIKIGKSWSHI